MALKLFQRRPKQEETKEELKVEAPAEPMKERTRTEIMRNPSKKGPSKAPVKKAPAKKEVSKKAVPKSTASRSSSKSTAKKTASKTAGKKAPAKKTAPPRPEKGSLPPELRGFEKRLKDYAVRARLEFSQKTANIIFTEYMSRVFRDTGHSMVIIRDPEGVITMLERADWNANNVKDKIVVRCVYLKKESIGVDHIRKAQQDGAFYHSDEIWCVTPTDFTNMAIKESRSEDSEVRLIDGRELYEEYISVFDKRDE